ncbi:unnamed protein product [Trichobilharzia regenti]|nr:unnamed protein product [Trichobilharzia regenti]
MSLFSPLLFSSATPVPPVPTSASGSFLCTVPTAEKCYELCQQHGCTDWPFHIPVSPADRIPRDNYRCRCFEEYKTCLYNPLSRRQIIID